jgi:2,4-dienoyl-CoA reductase-like NADH-dependent reductase (Old Yellow Enzyme family)
MRPSAIDPNSYPAMLAPFRLAGAGLRNRIIHASMTTMMGANGRVSADLVHYHASRARGGAAMLVTEPIGMARHQAHLPRTQAWNGEDEDGFRRWAGTVEEHGAHLIGQIQDAGRGRHYPGRTIDAIGASALPDELSWTVPKALTTEDIPALVEEFAQSSRRLQRWGFSGVELSCGHGHLFHQFFSPVANRRDDAYGGDWDRRVRFVAEIVAAIRALCGADFVIGLKLPGMDGIPGGIGPAEAAEIASRLTAGRPIDYVCFAQGAHARSLEMHVPDRNGPRLPYMDLIRGLRSSTNGVPVVALGRITDPAEAEAILAAGQAELVGLGRALVADPAWLAKAASNRAHDIRYCLSCNTCWGTIISYHRPIACVNNPRVGRPDEADFWPEPARVKRRITVVGAGVAGLEAAWVAAARGHIVTMFSASGEVGGKARLRALLPGGETITSIYDYQVVAARRAGAGVELGVTASLDDVLATRPDHVVVAAGSTMIRPDWLRADDDFVPDLRDAVNELAAVTKRQAGTAVLFDADHTEGVYAAAEFLKSLFDRVVIITPRDTIAMDMQLVTRQTVLRRMAEAGVDVVPSAVPLICDALGDGVVECENVYTGARCRFDDVALLTFASPRVAASGLRTALQGRGIGVTLVGDCLSPGELLAATASGHRAGNEI